MKTTEKQELKHRVEAKQHELQARIAKLKADSSQEAKESRERLEAKLKEVRGAVSDGWNNLTESAARKLNSWLDSN